MHFWSVLHCGAPLGIAFPSVFWGRDGSCQSKGRTGDDVMGTVTGAEITGDGTLWDGMEGLPLNCDHCGSERNAV